ncbi:hypothetical protein BGW41_007779 [Actinomortierella wolfii]|nr:hypothetical protein BGW41_007779 [Actinomortierella wolfii]
MLKSFALGNLIGAGGFGCVYRAERAGTICAAKKCYASHVELSQAAIRNEIAILLQIRHRHIIQYIDTVDHEGHSYILMDLAEKGSLAGAIVRGEVNDWPTKTRIAHEIARGLEYIHHHDILHRDLKTDNVLLTRYMEVKLCDFGLAKVKTASASASSDSFKGTFRWSAPETLELRPKYSKKSDIYSLGMVMWAMAANRPKPFEEQHVNKVIVTHVQSGEREVIPAATPLEYGMWIEQCWHQDPDQRPNARDVVLVENNPTVMPCEGLETTLSFSSSTYESIHERYASYEPTDMLGQLTFVDRHHEDSKMSKPCDDVLVYLRYKANEGNPDAQLFLGWVCEQGLGLIGTEDDAPTWYRKAADQGHATAQLKLGLSYERSGGTGQNQGENGAVEWYSKAAENGDAQAKLRLGLMYANGRGVPRNAFEAAKWFEQSAIQGVADAQFNISLMYSRGQGVGQSDSEAAKWMRQAAEQDMVEAQLGLGSMYYKGRGVDQSDEKASIWYHRAADGGHPAAQFHVGQMFSQGRGVEVSDIKAFEWFRCAAEQGHSDAQVELGLMYEEGRGIQEDLPMALSWYFKAADQAHGLAGRLISPSRLGYKLREARVENEFRKAARQGNVIAQRYLTFSW